MYSKKSFIKQLQLEQDSGKSLHDEEACRYVNNMSALENEE
jgi:Asp-tRNA(Asn)/Glu-tRNA(Gln) amidotransferase B subunit